MSRPEVEPGSPRATVEEDRLRLLVAAAGHDLRNRLHSMLMNVDLLGALKPAEVLRTDIGRMDAMLDQYLQIVGWHETDRVEVSVPALLDAAAARASMAVRVDAPAMKWMVDETAVGRAIDELVDNAVRAVQGAGAVALVARSFTHHIEVVVVDDGEGFSSERLPELMALGGSGWGRAGLGLSVVRQVARAHGGGLQLRSAGLGKGTEAVVRLL